MYKEFWRLYYHPYGAGDESLDATFHRKDNAMDYVEFIANKFFNEVYQELKYFTKITLLGMKWEENALYVTYSSYHYEVWNNEAHYERSIDTVCFGVIKKQSFMDYQ